MSVPGGGVSAPGGSLGVCSGGCLLGVCVCSGEVSTTRMGLLPGRSAPGGVCSREGVCLLGGGGVCSQGESAPGGCVCSGGGGVSALGGWYPTMH